MRVRQIDALRGIAALLVAAVFHIHVVLGPYRTGPLDGLPVFTWLHDHGWTLVDLFFVISGFIFAHVYAADGKLKGTIADFALARFARLYPLHLATLIVALAVGMRGDAFDFALNLLLINDGRAFNFPAWSITVEVLCYAIFVFAAKRRMLSALAPALVILGVALTLGNNPHADHIGRGLVGFFVGTLIYRREAPTSALLAVVALALLVPTFAPLSRGAAYSLTLYPAIVMLALKTPLSFQWLGDRSYSIYLWHAPVYVALRPVAPNWLAGILTVLVVADLSYRYLERPARRRLKALPTRHLDLEVRPVRIDDN